jgi:hypothetical protein
MNSEIAKSEYIQYIRKDFRAFAVNYISVTFPVQDQSPSANHKTAQDPWGVAWIRGLESKDKVNVFLSRLSGSILPDGCIPSSDFEIFERFLNHLKNEWNTACSVASMKIDGLVRCSIFPKAS